MAGGWYPSLVTGPAHGVEGNPNLRLVYPFPLHTEPGRLCDAGGMSLTFTQEDFLVLRLNYDL